MKKNIHDLATEYPEVMNIMIELSLRISIQLLLIPWEGDEKRFQRDHRLGNRPGFNCISV